MARPTGKFQYVLIGMLIAMWLFAIVGVTLGILLQSAVAGAIGLAGFLSMAFAIFVVRCATDWKH